MAGQVVPCPRCQAPIQVGVAAGPPPDDLFDELPSLEDQQAALSDEAIKKKKRERRKEQRLRDERLRKRAVEISGQAATIVAAVLLLVYAGKHGHTLYKILPLFDFSLAFSGGVDTVIMLFWVITELISVPLSLLGAALLLSRSHLARVVSIAAPAVVFVGLMTLMITAAVRGFEPSISTELVVEFVMEGVIVGLMFFPGVNKQLGIT